MDRICDSRTNVSQRNIGSNTKIVRNHFDKLTIYLRAAGITFELIHWSFYLFRIVETPADRAHADTSEIDAAEFNLFHFECE